MNPEIEKDLDKLARHIAKEATKANSLQESTDALKALTAYYAARTKNKGKGDDAEGDDSTNFGSFSGAIAAAQESDAHGRTKPPSSRRRDS